MSIMTGENTAEVRRCAAPGCDAKLVRRPSEKPYSYRARKTCSQHCAVLVGWNGRRILEKQRCEFCGELFDRRSGEMASNYRKRRTCSESCRFALMGTKQSATKRGKPNMKLRRRVEYQCQWCETTWFDKRYAVGRKKFCSQGCRSSHTVAAMAAKSPNTIEAETYRALDDLGLAHERQARVGRFVVDAYIPSRRIVIEVMGDYFHANPTVYPEPKNAMQQFNRDRDERRVTTLIAHGYELVVLWEKDIREHGARALLEAALRLSRQAA